MSTESVPKPRFVLCPKCWQLLQEAPNLDVYKCGGCGTTLQAKKRKSKAANSESSSHEIDAAPGNASDLSPQENVLREKETSSSSADYSSERSEGRDQIENSDYNGEQTVTTRENGLRETTSFSSSGECSLEGNTVRGQIENGDYNEEQPVISQENGLREKESSSSSGECSLDGNNEKVETENGECDEERIGPLNLPDEEPKNTMDINELSDISRRTESNKGCSNERPQCDIEASAESLADNSVEKENETNLKLEEEESNGNMPLEREGSQLVSALEREDASNEISDLVGVKSEADIGESDLEVAREFDNGNLSQGADQKLIFGSDEQCVCNEKLAVVGESRATDVDGINSRNLLLQRAKVDTGGNASSAERLSFENIESGKRSILCISPRELKVGTSDNHASSLENIRHSFDRVMSADTFDDTEVNNIGLKISGSLGDFIKSPTTRSSHAYDGSVSSNDGTDERSLGQNLYSFEGDSRKGKGVVNSMVYEDNQTQYQNEMVETTRQHDHAHWMRTKKDEFPFKMPLHGNFSQSGYESGSPSNQIYDEVYVGSSYVSPDSVEDPDQEKMKLLRMVYKLQDQLNRTRHVNRETNERPSVLNHSSSYQSHDFHDGRFYHGLDYPNEDANASYSHGINMHQRRHNFSGIAPGNTRYVDHPSFNCYPQEQQCLGNFSPQFPYQREDLYRPHSAHNRVLSQHSYPSSPQWLSTKHVHGRETKSCDQRYRAPEMNYTREKSNVTKRHYRPVAGGAPFLTCLKCLNLLQLPADFLLFKRVCHKLKCGACQEVLKFSLQNRIHIISYAPTSSELDVQNMVINGINSHAADPVSYSDDYGHSASKSYSSEGDPFSVAPFHHSRGEARGIPRVSPSTVESTTEKKKIASRGPSTSKTPSDKSSEIEEHQSQPKTSALHQLMGYSSPSIVIRGASSSVEGKKAMLSGEY